MENFPIGPFKKYSCYKIGPQIEDKQRTRGRMLEGSSPTNWITSPACRNSTQFFFSSNPMCSFAKHIILCHANLTIHYQQDPHHRQRPTAAATADEKPVPTTRRWAAISTVLVASAMLGVRRPEPVQAQSWGTHSFIKERYFQPGLSPEEAVDRIRQTAEGMHDLRHMLDTMSWRYVMFYIRLKQAYLEADLKNAITTLPESRRQSYVRVANELVDNMTEMDIHVRTPKVYESYLYYEKTLKSLDDLVALLT